jgi:hypothetical protein
MTAFGLNYPPEVTTSGDLRQYSEICINKTREVVPNNFLWYASVQCMLYLLRHLKG